MTSKKIKVEDLKLVLKIFENDNSFSETLELSEIRNGIMLSYKNQDGTDCEIMLTDMSCYLGPKIRRTNWARKDDKNGKKE